MANRHLTIRAVKIRELTQAASVLLNVARAANDQGDGRQWRCKVLEAFILIDHAWKIASGNAHESDEIVALHDFDALEAAMHRRFEAMTSDRLPLPVVERQ